MQFGRGAVSVALLVALLTGCGAADLVQPPSGASTSTATDPEGDASPSGLNATPGRDAAFFATVTDIGGAEHPEIVQLDHGWFTISSVQPIGTDCYSASAKLLRQALAVRDELLPVGARVWAVRRFGEGATPAVYLFVVHTDVPPADTAQTVNEQLVASGYWVPDWMFLANVATPKLKYDTGTMYGVDERYAPQMVRAANHTYAARVGGQALCQATEKLENARLQARIDAQYAAWKREFDRWVIYYRNHPGAAYCRDGDGDGICYEQ